MLHALVDIKATSSTSLAEADVADAVPRGLNVHPGSFRAARCSASAGATYSTASTRPSPLGKGRSFLPPVARLNAAFTKRVHPCGVYVPETHTKRCSTRDQQGFHPANSLTSRRSLGDLADLLSRATRRYHLKSIEALTCNTPTPFSASVRISSFKYLGISSCYTSASGCCGLSTGKLGWTMTCCSSVLI